jgi:hypothetical protein
VKKTVLGVALLGLVLLGDVRTTRAGPNIVVNGGFETGDFTGWNLLNILGDLPNMTWVDNSPNAPHSGNYAAQLGFTLSSNDPHFDTSITDVVQDLPTAAGHVYTLQFWFTGTNSPGERKEFRVRWNGQTLLDMVNVDPPTTWTQYTFNNLVATGSSTELAFGERNDPGWFGLDDVSVQEFVIPEPAGLTLAGVGVIGLVGYGWRRRKKAA